MTRPRHSLAVVLAAALIVPASFVLSAQEQFQFVVSATDAQGKPVSDLMREEVVMSENGVENEIVKIEPFKIPVKVTLAIDNGPSSRESLSHYRSGLEGLVRALPAGEVEVTIITISPQPRRVIPPTTELLRQLRGLTSFAPENESPRFTDALVEFSKGLEDELKKTKKIDSLPILVMVSTTANEASSYQPSEVNRALIFLQQRKARVYVTMTSAKQDVEGLSQINAGRQAIIAIPATKATRGRYEALANPSRLATLLPEFGREIAALHLKHNNQYLVTARRKEGLKGALQNPTIEITRAGVTGDVSLDGLP
jgi:hypothetical protein